MIVEENYLLDDVVLLSWPAVPYLLPRLLLVLEEAEGPYLKLLVYVVRPAPLLVTLVAGADK